jgi:hypothetical protein
MMENSAFSQPSRAPQHVPPQPGEPGLIGPLLPENPQPGQPGFIGPLPNPNPIQLRPYVIQIPPQGGFAGVIAIIPPNHQRRPSDRLRRKSLLVTTEEI